MAKLPKQRESLLVERRRSVVVALAPRKLAEAVRSPGDAPGIAQMFRLSQALFDQQAGLGRFRFEIHLGDSERARGGDNAPAVVELAEEAQALGRQRPDADVVALHQRGPC